MKRLQYLIFIVSFLILPTAAGAETDYYAIFMNSKKIGYAALDRVVVAGEVRSTQKIIMTIARMNVPISITMTETHIETTDGKPLAFESTQDMSGFIMKVAGTVKPDGTVDVEVTSTAGSQEQSMIWPTGALMSEGLSLLQEKKGMAEGTTYEVNAFSAAMLNALTTRITIGPKKKVDLLGRVVIAREVKSIVKNLAGGITETNYVNDDQQMLKSVVPMMGMQMELVTCGKAFALSQSDVVDFFDKLLLAAPKPLEDIEKAESADYYIMPTENRKLSFPHTDSQSVRPYGEKGLIVTVRPQSMPADVVFPYKGSDARALAALKPNRFLQSDHREIIDMARRAIGNTKDTAEAVGKIEHFVCEHIEEKNLSVGYASAVEVVRSRQGDCSEHAVLVAALCRAVGIPAEVVVGMGYFRAPGSWSGAGARAGSGNGLFGPHAWTQVYLDGRWFGIDATGSPRGFRAGHITLGAGSGGLEDFFEVITNLGYFRIVDIK